MVYKSFLETKYSDTYFPNENIIRFLSNESSLIISFSQYAWSQFINEYTAQNGEVTLYGPLYALLIELAIKANAG